MIRFNQQVFTEIVMILYDVILFSLSVDIIYTVYYNVSYGRYNTFIDYNVYGHHSCNDSL